MIITTKILRIYFILICTGAWLHSNLAQARTLSTNPENPSEESRSAILSDFESQFKQAQEDIKSDEGFRIIRGIRFLHLKFSDLEQKQKLTADLVKHLIFKIDLESDNIRGEVQNFFDQHVKAITTSGLITLNDLVKIRENIYNDNQDFLRYLVLISSLEQNQLFKEFHLTRETTLDILDGLVTSDRHVAQTSSSILSKHMNVMMDKGLWDKIHTRKFFAELPNVNNEHQDTYLDAFQGNFYLWVDREMITKEDFHTLMKHTRLLNPDLQQKFFTFITSPETLNKMSKVGLFDQEWADTLIKDIVEGLDDSHESALMLLTYTLQAFAKTGAIKHEGFRAIHDHLQIQNASVEDPFGMYRRNFSFLVQQGWYQQSDFAILVEQAPLTSEARQIQILDFIDAVYSPIYAGGWLRPTQTAALVLDNGRNSKNLLAHKLKFLVNHPEIYQDGFFDRAQLKQFLTLLKSDESTHFDPAYRITDIGLPKWVNQKTFDEEHLLILLDTNDPNSSRSEKLLKLIETHLASLGPVWNQDLVEDLSLFGLSSNPSITAIIERIFLDQAEWFKKQHFITGKVQRNLKDVVTLKAKKISGKRTQQSVSK